jgi:hypothetical protein
MYYVGRACLHLPAADIVLVQRHPRSPYGFFLAALLEDGPVAFLAALGVLALLVLTAG